MIHAGKYAISGVIVVANTSNRTICSLISSLLVKKNTDGIFFVFYACHFRITPYNAPPLTRNNGLQAAGLAGFSDELSQRKAK
jgi:hypothetical protein